MTAMLSPQDLREAQELLDQLASEVKRYEGALSGGTKLDKGSDALQALRETLVKFGNPNDNLIRLTPKLFEQVGVELTEIYKRQMRDQFDFYYMSLTVSLQPKRGAHFRLIECRLDLGPKGAGEPIVQTLFPQSEWNQVLGWGGGLNLALDANLEWGAEVSSLDDALLQKLPAHLQSNLANKNSLKAFITVPDYSFNLGRVEIAATGQGNSECFWRIEKPTLQAAQTVQFGLVFKVPKGTPSIELTGLAAAEPDMNWLVDNLRNVFEDLSDKLRSLLRRQERDGKERLPIGDHETWTIKLPA